MTDPQERGEIDLPLFKYRSKRRSETAGILLLLKFAQKRQQNLDDKTWAEIIDGWDYWR